MTSAHQDDSRTWHPSYQKRDFDIVDYQEYELPGVELPLRGPRPAGLDTHGSYFTCIGAAQTYGVWVEKPYPALMAEQLGMPALNLGICAAGPGYFASRSKLIEYINNGRFLILQVMAARAESNSRYEQAGYCEIVRDRATDEVLGATLAFRRIFSECPDELPALAAENRANWQASYQRLIEQVKVPIILFWYSHERRVSEQIDFTKLTLENLTHDFPQLVDGACAKPIADMCNGFVACESRRGHNHRLISRFTNQPVAVDNELIHKSLKGNLMTHNSYYPSAEMHEDAADVLLRELIKMEQRAPGLLGAGRQSRIRCM